MSEVESKSLIETTAKSFGRDMHEAKSLGHVDRADSDVETLFGSGKKTEDSPAFRACWGPNFSVSEFGAQAGSSSAEGRKVMEASLAVIKRRLKEKSFYGDDGKITEDSLGELAKVGYWGVLIDKEYGGSGASFLEFARFLAQVAEVESTVAGLASVHGCIGAVDPLVFFGDEEQKKKYLPLLANGQKLSAFALTEPNAGSDLTAIRTTARLVGDHYLVTGKKLFITNAGLNRTIGLVCLIEGEQAVLIVDLPEKESENFKINKYGLWALSRARNIGMEFNEFPVPRENLLKGKGLMIAYHGLNKGRVALCANAAGTMRRLLANLVPWAKYRVTYTKQIGERELVQRRLGEMLGLIVGCDALVDWCASLLDEGYRGEMECIIAKRFGSEALKEAAIEFVMKTHGGRSFLHGHEFGDNLHDFLAPCIYEGEGEMLAMAFFKALTKQHGEEFFLPIAEMVGKLRAENKIKDFNPFNPIHAFLMRAPLINYSKWFVSNLITPKNSPELSGIDKRLRKVTKRAIAELAGIPRIVSSAMVKHQVALIDRQCRIVALSERVQNLLTIVATNVWASKQKDELSLRAAELLSEKLLMKIDLKHPSDSYYRKATKLGKMIIAGDYDRMKDIPTEELLMPYDS